jgi:surface polysaccharide O-acyltransferase-like enzyme
MNDEQIKKIIDGTYEEPREDTIWSMVGDFYNRKMLSMVVILWAWAIVFMAVTIFSGVKFFAVEQTKSQIMYAAIFICGCQFIALIKIFAWQLIHRNGIKREIKRLELRIAELGENLKTK